MLKSASASALAFGGDVHHDLAAVELRAVEFRNRAGVRLNDMDDTREWKETPLVRTDADGRFRHETPATMHELLVTADRAGAGSSD